MDCHDLVCLKQASTVRPCDRRAGPLLTRVFFLDPSDGDHQRRLRKARRFLSQRPEGCTNYRADNAEATMENLITGDELSRAG